MKKKNNKKSNIIVMLDYILYNHNRHEVGLANKFADNYGMRFNVRPGNPKFMEDSENVQNTDIFDFRTACDWPWKAVTIDCNRNINPCCEYSVFSNKTPYEKSTRQDHPARLPRKVSHWRHRLHHRATPRSRGPRGTAL